MKKLHLYILIALTVATGGSSCTKHILEKVNLNGIPGNEVWSDSTLSDLYLNNLYNLVMPVWPCNENATSTFPSSFHNTSDESNGGTAALLQGTLTTESVTDFYASGTAGAYPTLRKINLLFANIDNYGLKPAQTVAIKAQAYFLRAYVYFDLLKLYGGIPYITIPLDWETDSLNLPRNSTSQCIDSIMADLSHCSILPAVWPATEFGRITRGAALAFKSRVLLTWASPQFNPTNDMSRWQLALTAAQNANDTCTMDGYGLYSNFSRISLDVALGTDKEPLIFRPFNGANSTGEYEGYDGVTRPYSQSAGSGGQTNNPTWNLVQAFPMADGKTINSSSTKYPYDSVYYWHNRDPRFYSTIVYNGAVYGLGSTPDRHQWMYTGITADKGHVTTTGFYCRKNIDTTVSAANSVYGKTFWVELRFAEVLLNLAECANMMGNQSLAYTELYAIRKRAGIVNSDGYYGVPQNISTDSMESVILQEREVEFAFEGRRYDDLRRTRTFDKLDGSSRYQIVVAFNTAANKNYTVANFEKVNTTTSLAPIDTVNVDGPDYTKYFTHTFIPITGDQQINFLTTYYAYGIPSSDISKQPAMQQTLGWLYAGGQGTFDPTK
jgi:hypothetical protein